MNILKTSKRQTAKNRSRLFFYCLLLSIGLHLLAVILLPFYENSKNQKLQQKPTIVRLVEQPVIQEKPVNERLNEYEIDQVPLQPQPPIPVESHRKAEKNQKVVKEQAPKGKDVRDQIAAKEKQKNQETMKQQVPPPSIVEKQSQKNIDLKSLPQQRKAQQQADSTPARERMANQTPPSAPTLTPRQLMPDSNTLDHIASGTLGDRNRIKERQDAEIGDTVWLNLQHDLLVSFFRRFHDQVERVWNYPKEAALAGVEGTLELLITVDKNGELVDVDLRRGSGSDILDFEAIQAVYRAAPFGPLTKHYPHEKLNIRAHFRYSIVGKYIYGNQ